MDADQLLQQSRTRFASTTDWQDIARRVDTLHRWLLSGSSQPPKELQPLRHVLQRGET